MNDFPKSRLTRLKNTRFSEKTGVLPGMSAEKGGYSLQNLAPTPEGLRTHIPLVCAPSQESLTDIRGIYPFDDKLLVLDVYDGHLRFCIYDGGECTVAYTSQEECEENFEASDFSTGIVYTEDVLPEIAYGLRKGKILYFPAHKYTLTSNDHIGFFRDLPESVPCLERAVVCGGRLYGTIGQTVYVSGKNGCFDWVYDGAEDEGPDPDHAFFAPIMTQTEKQTPVTALKVYRGNVYIFRENAMQKIVGTANPFAVKEVFRIGCADDTSIQELNGLLCFTSGGKAYEFNGSSLKELPLPEENASLYGPACVYDGRYCVCGEKDGEEKLYSYDPGTGTYGTLLLPGRILSFAGFGGNTAAAVETANSGVRIYRFDSAGRENVAFEAIIPLMRGRHDVQELAGLTVRYRQISSSLQFKIYACVKYDDGTTENVFLGEEEEGSGCITARRRALIRGAALVDLRLTGTGEAVIGSCFAHFRLKSGQRVKT